MLYRPKFITNSSSTAYIMYGIKLNDEERRAILKHIWFDRLTKEQREEIGIGYEFDYDLHNDKDKWEELLDDLEHDVYYDEFHEKFFGPVGLEFYEKDSYADKDSDYLLYIPDSFDSVYSDELKVLKLPTGNDFMEWIIKLREITKPAGVDKNPNLFITGKRPGE